MKINYPLIFEMTGCDNCECMIRGEDNYDSYCFLDKQNIKLYNGDIIDIIPEDCPARQYEEIDVHLILNNIVEDIRKRFKCKARWEFYPEDYGQYFIKILDKNIYESKVFQDYIWDVMEKEAHRINLNVCYGE
jgi:hypothetical protein